MLLISYGSLAFHVYKWYDENTGSAGLNIIQWAICIAFGSGTLLVRVFLRFLTNFGAISQVNILLIIKILF